MNVNNMNILAIDPGGTTGFCWKGFDDEIGYEQMPAMDARRMALTMFAWEFPPTVIVMESFILHPSAMKKSRKGIHDAIETIGVYRTITEILHRPFIEQTPAQGKRITNKHLEEAGIFVKGNDHARDAARHLYLYLATTGQL